MMQSALYRCDNDAKSFQLFNPISKRQQFLARKIHKIKKMLKLRSRQSAPSREPSLEERQNAENERMYSKLDVAPARRCPSEVEENSINENWENWDACHVCAGVEKQNHGPNAFDSEDYDDDHSVPYQQAQSICYVFMPDQCEPVPVRLRTARIAGGVLCVTYRPDGDLRHNSNYLCSYTSFQQPQAQQALRPIMV